MACKRISKAQLHAMTQKADGVASLASSFGTYDAIVWTDGKVFRVATESLNPVSDVSVEEIDDIKADELMKEY